MDSRVYILPVMSAVIVLVLLSNPDITGFMVAEPSESQISAKISISIDNDGFVPEDSLITVHLDDQNSSMDFRKFVERTGTGYSRIKSELAQIGYKGYGYAGIYTYVLDINEFDLNTIVEPGEHELIIEVSYGNYVISHISQNILV